MRHAILIHIATGLALAAAPVAGQQEGGADLPGRAGAGTRAGPVTASGQQTCPDGRITRIFVDNHSIFDLDRTQVESLEWAYRLANKLHIRTRESFIRREVVFEAGDCYQPFLMADSERVLRRLPFIADADVYGVRQEDGNWHAVVDTRDEWSTRVEVSAEFEDGFELRNVSLSEQNFLGYGAQVGIFSNRNDASQSFGGEVALNQVGGTRADIRLAGGETQVGRFYTGDVAYPFIGEISRTAWRAFFSSREDYFDYSTGTPAQPGHILSPVREETWELTFGHRFGEPGNLTLVGGGISREEADVLNLPDGLRRVEGNDFGNLLPAPPEAQARVAGQTFFSSGTRVNLLFGQRNIRFVQRVGLDALQGVTDVEVGSDVALTLSRTVAGVTPGVAPEDLGVRFRFYAAKASTELISVLSAGVDARQIFFDATSTRTGWRDLLAELDGLLYWQPRALPNHTLVLRAAGAGGWTVDRPFQLTLGGPTGVRGYRQEAFPGGRRIVFNLEDRVYLGWPVPDLLDLGFTAFADAGAMWAGDVPYGRDWGWHGSVGFGLRLGFPAGSRGVARIDLAWPVGADGIASGPVLRIALADLLGLAGGLEDGQMRRSRLLGVGPDRFAPRR